MTTYEEHLENTLAAFARELARERFRIVTLTDERQQLGAALKNPAAELAQAESKAEHLRIQILKIKDELHSILSKAEKGERVEVDITYLIDLCISAARLPI